MPIKKILVLLVIASLLFQVSFSIYYSSEIISKSNKYIFLMENINKLEIEHQKLQTKLASETSLEKLSRYINEKKYQPIWQQINLNQP